MLSLISPHRKISHTIYLRFAAFSFIYEFGKFVVRTRAPAIFQQKNILCANFMYFSILCWCAVSVGPEPGCVSVFFVDHFTPIYGECVGAERWWHCSPLFALLLLWNNNRKRMLKVWHSCFGVLFGTTRAHILSLCSSCSCSLTRIFIIRALEAPQLFDVISACRFCCTQFSFLFNFEFIFSFLFLPFVSSLHLNWLCQVIVAEVQSDKISKFCVFFLIE